MRCALATPGSDVGTAVGEQLSAIGCRDEAAEFDDCQSGVRSWHGVRPDAVGLRETIRKAEPESRAKHAAAAALNQPRPLRSKTEARRVRRIACARLQDK